ncbi:MAG: ribosome maturation factor RimM [Beijerinckiaceae bacterium]
MTGSSKILVGAFGAAHGIRGEVRLKSFTANPAAIGIYGPLQDESGTRHFMIEALRPIGKDLLVARVNGVSDRNAAEALNGTELFVSRDALPAPDEGEFYHADLIGSRVEDDQGRVFGSVVAVHNFGAGDILEIAPSTDAADQTTAMLAFTRALVPVVDVEGGRIVVASDPFAESAEENN